MLCKTAVARKVLVHAWKNDISLANAEIHPIDAAVSFGAAVDACLLVCSLSPASHNQDCRVYGRLGDSEPTATIGYHDGQLVADVATYERWKHLAGNEVYKWRSGVKHDCSKVMELRKEGNRYRNGLDKLIELEGDYMYPMLKSSEITNGQSKEPSRWMLVTQKSVGDETSVIRVLAEKTWEYLQKQGELLDRRASSIYRNRPRFSVFGVGDYTFAPWKVAISGFYKKLQFATVGPHAGKPVVLDDTSYFAEGKGDITNIASGYDQQDTHCPSLKKSRSFEQKSDWQSSAEATPAARPRRSSAEALQLSAATMNQVLNSIVEHAVPSV